MGEGLGTGGATSAKKAAGKRGVRKRTTAGSGGGGELLTEAVANGDSPMSGGSALSGVSVDLSCCDLETDGWDVRKGKGGAGVVEAAEIAANVASALELALETAAEAGMEGRDTDSSSV